MSPERGRPRPQPARAALPSKTRCPTLALNAIVRALVTTPARFSIPAVARAALPARTRPRWPERTGKAARATSAWLAVLLLAGCNPPDTAKSGKKDGKAAPTLPARTVQAAPAESRPMERAVSVIGALAAIDHATLSVKVTGRLQSLSVDLGTRVKKGELVAQIESVDYELKLKSAEALLAQARARLGLLLVGADDTVKGEETSTVRQAKASLLESQKQCDRTRELAKRGISSQADLEIVEANFEIAFNRHLEALEDIRQRQGVLQQRRVEVEIARQQLADTKIVAPFDGIVQERKASPGEFLNTAAPIVTLVKVDPLRLRVEVPERNAAGVRPGQKVRLTIEGDTNKYTGTIARRRSGSTFTSVTMGAAVFRNSPGLALRSCTMPSKGATIRVSASCWRAISTSTRRCCNTPCR